MGNGKGVNFVCFRIVFTTLIRQNVLDCVAPDDETLRQFTQLLLYSLDDFSAALFHVIFLPLCLISCCIGYTLSA